MHFSQSNFQSMASKGIMVYKITKIFFRLYQSALMQQGRIDLRVNQVFPCVPSWGFAHSVPHGSANLPPHSTIQLDALISKPKHCTVCLPSDKAVRLKAVLFSEKEYHGPSSSFKVASSHATSKDHHVYTRTATPTVLL